MKGDGTPPAEDPPSVEAAATKKLQGSKRARGRPPKHKTPSPKSTPTLPPPPPFPKHHQPLASSGDTDVGPVVGTGPPVDSPGGAATQQPPAAKQQQGTAGVRKQPPAAAEQQGTAGVRD